LLGNELIPTRRRLHPTSRHQRNRQPGRHRANKGIAACMGITVPNEVRR
jgi:hypothetical protein